MSTEERTPPAFSAVDFDPFAGPQIVTTVPSTEPQREIWTAARLGTEASLAFNESVSFRFRGDLDVQALEASFALVLARHEALRSTFTSDGLTLCVAAEPAAHFSVLDLSGLAPAEQEVERARVLAQEVEDPFDLERGPLVRLRLLKLGPRDHLAVVTGHHIVVDGWSWAVIAADWARLFTARRRGTPAALDPADRFSEYASEQAGRIGSPDRVADETYWLKQCEGELPVLDLPGDRPRPAWKSFPSRREDISLDSALVQELKKVGAKEGASFFATLLASFKVLLHRLTSLEDVIVGIPAAGQAASGRKTLVGHCVSTLPLRSRLDAQEPFRAVLKRVRTTLLDAYDHQDFTFGALLKKLPIPRDPSRQPLVSVVFNVDQTLSKDALAFDGLDVEFRSNPRHFETFDLFVNAVDGGGGTVLECQYNTDLFDRETLLRWVGCLEVLLRGIVADPGQAIGRLPVLAEEEKHRLLQAWNETGRDFRPEATIHGLFAERAAAAPDAVALIGEQGTLTYAELDRRANRLARNLRRRGVGADVCVGLCLERSFDTIVALLGILKAGGAYLPLESNYPKERLAFMLEDARVPLVVTQSSLAATLPEHGGATLFLDREAARLDEEDDLPVDGGATAQSLAYVIYTSGSTGKPKGVLVTHRAVNRLVCDVDYVPLGSQETLLHAANLAFDASTFEIWGALLNGGRLALYPENVPTGAGLARAIREYGVTTLWLTTALFHAVVDEDPAILSGVARILTGGEVLSVPHARRAQAALPKTELVNCYGPTESTTFTTTYRIPADLPPEARPVPIGRPIRDTRLYVVDKQMQPVPVGVVGELLIGGEGVARGYLNRPELTAERFIPDPFGAAGDRVYRTGDLVRYLSTGDVDFVGRSDDQVKIRGFRIELGEIEAALASHEAVAQAAVAVREDRTGSKILLAYAVPSPGASCSADDLLEHLRRSLPKFMIPQHLTILERMPLNASGKVDRKALPAPVDAPRAVAEHVAPRTPNEELLARLWEKALGLPRVSVTENFFSLGGHSLLAAQVLSRLNREHGIVLPFRTIFEAPTVEQLARVIDAGTESAQPEVARIPRRASKEPAAVSIMQERILLLEDLDPERYRVHNVPSAFRLKGPLDPVALSRSLGDVVARHESLRTTFRRQGGVFVQVVGEPRPIALAPIDLASAPGSTPEDAVRSRLLEEIGRPFDLEAGPLFLALLFRLAEDDHVFFTLRHNAIWDGWSFDIFRHELTTLYDAYRRGERVDLPEPPISYSDFAEWHREFVKGPECGKQLAYWRKALADRPSPLELPTDRPRPAVRTYAGADLWIDIPRAEADSLTELGRRSGATLFMVLLAAFDVLLSRHSGQTDVLVATPVRNRTRPETEDVIGLFTNTLMMRTEVRPDEPFADLLTRVRAATLDAFTHQDVPFDLLGKEAPPVRVLFSMQEARHRATTLGEASLTLPHVLPPAAAVDLNFWLVEMKDGLKGAANYSTEIFDRGTVEGLLEQYRTLLRSILEAPREVVGRLALVSAEEQRRLVALASAASVPEARIEALVAQQARRRPDAVAVEAGPTSLTYGELASRVDRLAGWLRDRGLAEGGTVALALERPLDRLTALLAVSRSSARAVLLDHRHPVARLKAHLDHARPSHVWADPDLADDLGEGWTLLPSDALQGTAVGADLPAVSPPSNATAWSVYVSTPAAPLAVDVPHGSVAASLADAARRLGLGPEDVALVGADTTAFELLLPLVAGAKVLACADDEAEDALSLARALEVQGVTLLVAPTETWQALVASGWQGRPALKAVASSLLPSALAERLAGLAGSVASLFGDAEVGAWWALERVTREDPRAIVGRSLAGVDLDARDAAGEPCPPGVPGRVFVRWGNGWSPTGDRARRLPDGRFLHLGREDARLTIRGLRVEPREVEICLLAHPAVLDAGVVLREDVPGAPRLVAYVVARPGATYTDTELRRHLRRTLPAPAIPQHVVAVDEIPRQADGRLDLRVLPAPFKAAGEVRAPSSDEERLLVDLWESALGTRGVRIDDNFFNLGGHSLLSLELVARIESQTGKRIKPRLLLLSTLEQVAAELARTPAGV